MNEMREEVKKFRRENWADEWREKVLPLVETFRGGLLKAKHD